MIYVGSIYASKISMGRRGRDCTVVGFTVTITTKFFISNPAPGEAYSIQHYVIRFISDFLQVLRFPPPIKLHDCHDIAEILLKVTLNTVTLILTLKYV